MLLREVAEASAQVASSRSRLSKVGAIAALLRRADAHEVGLVVAFLSGELRQRQTGVGYAALSRVAAGRGAGPGAGRGAGPDAAALTVADVDSAFEKVAAVAGPGAGARRQDLLADLFARAAPGERGFLMRLLSGELRQGALEGVMAEAVARAAGVPAAGVRRAHLLGGSLPTVAGAALGASREGGPGAAMAALAAVAVQVGRPLRPMLAASAPSLAAALERISPAAVEWKIDGIRIQLHRRDGDVRVFTRTLDDITARVPEIAEAASALDVRSAVLDGEAVVLGPGGRPQPFQVTAARAGSHADVAGQRAKAPLTPFFFDLLHLDGAELVDRPGEERRALLAQVAPADLLVPRLVTADRAEAERFFADAIARGHEGVLVKSPAAAYSAGRRGAGWIKVKPRHTLDLVVLAAEWGHGRRRGWLSNLHLGARDPAAGGLIMLGKTFKGLTDEMLAWQTRRLLELADPATAGGPGRGHERGQAGQGGGSAPYGVVRVRPELVVEVAFDGVQASSRYPGGLALRFARVLRHRPDKPAAEADTIETLRALWPLGAAAGE